MVRRSAAVSVLALSVATLSACAAAPDAPETTLAAASPMVVAAAQPPRVAPTPVAKPEDDAAFYGFLQNFRSQALAAGVSAATYDAATGGIAPNARIKIGRAHV